MKNEQGRPRQTGPADNHHHQGTALGYPTQPLRDQLGDWWNDPATAYWVGLQDGVELARRQDEEDHRAAVQGVVRFIDAADRRAASDRGEVAA